MDRPTVSVVMPAYNAKRYITDAVESVLAQTFRDFELIIIDDGSTDGTEAILMQLAAKDSRIRLTRRPNTGIVGALNDALARANGEFVARMDADDLSFPERFEKQLTFLREHPDCVCVGTQIQRMDPYGTPLHREEHNLTHAEIDTELMTGRGFAMVHPTVMMRREAVETVGGYRKQYEISEDLDLFLRLGEVGTLANLSDLLLHYRIHYNSINHQKHEYQQKIKRGLMEEAYKRRGVPLTEAMEFKRKVPPPKYEQTCVWGWGALKKGHLQAARLHALDAMKLHPFKADSWRLMFCALRGS